MKYYDFVDKQPPIGKLVIVEGTERVLAECAVETIVERVLPPDMRQMNVDRFAAAEFDGAERLREAVAAMPFLAASRVVVLTDAQALKAALRRELWDAAQSVPEGNTLVICDLLSPRSKRPEPFGPSAGRAALRIDTMANDEVRTRFVRETLVRLNARAEPRVVEALARSQADLASIRNDLEKLALSGKTIVYKDFVQESLTVEDPKAYRYAGALVEGRAADALEIAREMLANDRGAAVPLVAALAAECGMLWELARKGGELPERLRWRGSALRPIAVRIGEQRARRAFERTVAAFESIVTGKVDDPELVVDMLTAELSSLGSRR